MDKQTNAQTPALTNERRKQELITEGFVYRGNVRSATARVKAGLHPETMAHGVLGMVAKTALGLFAGRKATGGGGGLAAMGLKTALPLAMTVIKLFRERSEKPRPVREGSVKHASLMSRLPSLPRLPRVRKPTLIKGGIAAGIIGGFAAVGAYVLRHRRMAADL